MVCPTCEKKIERVICPEPWKEKNGSTGKKGPENKLLTNQKRWKPYTDTCKVCKQVLHQPGKYCLGCAYERGICSKCGKQIIDTSMYRMSDSAPKKRMENKKEESCPDDNGDTGKQKEETIQNDRNRDALLPGRNVTENTTDKVENVAIENTEHPSTTNGVQKQEGKDAKADWIYDPRSGYYYDESSGYHYDPKTQLYFDSRIGRWITS